MTTDGGWDDLWGVDRGLGGVEMASNRALGPFSQAAWRGAENLLTKARRHLVAGDDDRAQALVRRATALAYDPHEDAAPAALAVHMMLFSAVVDELEPAEKDDERWLDAALVVVHEGDEMTQCEMRDVLTPIRQDYEISARERRRIDTAIRAIPPRVELRDQGPVPVAQLTEQVTSALRATIAYEEAIRRG